MPVGSKADNGFECFSMYRVRRTKYLPFERSRRSVSSTTVSPTVYLKTTRSPFTYIPLYCAHPFGSGAVNGPFASHFPFGSAHPGPAGLAKIVGPFGVGVFKSPNR